jgi:hypothetical protein
MSDDRPEPSKLAKRIAVDVQSKIGRAGYAGHETRLAARVIDEHIAPIEADAERYRLLRRVAILDGFSASEEEFDKTCEGKCNEALALKSVG